AYTLKNPDFLKENLWQKIIRPIKILHTSRIEVSKVFDPLVEVKKLYEILGSINRDYPEFDISGTINDLERIYNKASVKKDDFVLCHNDLLADNFMLTNDREKYPEEMYLIDWEYAGMNTCYYEVADMFQEILVPRDVERNLLEIYWEGKNMDYNIYMTDLFKPFPDIFWFLWSLIQLNISKIDFDYYNYGRVKYENALSNIQYARDNYGIKI
ncbi:MAG: phosphotransferase family protein, partial [Spirochaetota bacterium]